MTTRDLLGEWLDAAQLGHLEAPFQLQGIELSQVAELSEAHLRELGLSIGDRLRFRQALRALPPQRKMAKTFPERRPLSVMFVDVVDSTGLSDQLDVEDLIEVIRLYREFCDGVIRQFGGQVAQFFGDGIMAYFCYPVAHENDAERAVRAALGIAEGVRRLVTPAGRPVHVRVGVATGRVVISDLFSGGSLEERKVSGATPNLAARLQGFAGPDGVVISEVTHGLVGALFDCADLGRQDLRGFGAPQHIFGVTEVRAHSTGGTLAGTPLTPLFGRDRHLEALAACWREAEAGRGCVAVVAGEAGIGKSRLTERFLGTLAGPSRVVRIQGSPFDQQSPLRPFAAYFRVEAGFAKEDGAAARLGKLSAVLLGPGRETDLVPLAELLQVRMEADGAPLAPAAVRTRALDAITRQLLALSEAGPVCLVVEDMHWLDATSLALLSQLAEAVRGRAMLLMATTREEERAEAVFPGEGTSWVRPGRLRQADVIEMVQSLFGDDPVPATIARQIARKTDGVPLFVEEYVRPLLLANAGTDWTSVADRSLTADVIPTSLHESLMSRLDRSGPGKEVAQIAAVIGRAARRDMLAAVSGLPERELDGALHALHGAGVLRSVQRDGRMSYVFGHALVQVAAYDSILRDRRRELHAKVAEAMAALDPETVALQPELLATHLTEGGKPGQAIEHWIGASQRSVRRSSLFEAVGLLRRALAAIDAMEAGPDGGAERSRLRLQAMALLGPALIAVRGPGSAEAQALYAEAFALAESEEAASGPGAHFPLAWGWWRVARDFTLKKERAATLLSRARARDDREMLLQAHHCNWAAHFELGQFCACAEHVAAGLAIYGSGDFTHHATMYGNHDARVCGHGELSQVYWMQGRLGEAARHEGLALSWAERLGHLGSRVHAMDMALLHRSFQRDHLAVRRRADALVSFTAEHGLADHRAKGMIFSGWSMARDGAVAAGIEAIRRGMGRQREIGTLEDFPMYVSMLAEALVADGRADLAVEELLRARAEFGALGLQIWLPELLRHLGAAMLAADPASTGAAAGVLAEAAALSRLQGAGMLGLRIGLDHARLAERMGDHEAAHGHLAGVTAGLPGGESSAEHRDAAAHLDRLARRLGRAPAEPVG